MPVTPLEIRWAQARADYWAVGKSWAQTGTRPLTSLQEASTADWPLHDIIQLLKTGLSSRAATAGPMADVVSQSLQHLDEQDAHAMATYLKSLPQSDPRSRGVAPLTEEVDKLLARGGDIYKTLCEDCHGNLGQA